MIRWAAAVWLALALPAAAACEDISHRDQSFTTCTADLAQVDLHLFLNDANGDLVGTFERAADTLGAPLLFAMNAGMYHPDRAPVGHYVQNGEQVMRVITTAGPGNFGMLPNGVFCLREGRADVFETLRFVDQAPACTAATQSGPMLVIDGALHPRFLPDSPSRNIRNGVGTSADGTRAVFVISNSAVTFHEMATLFRDVLGLPNALYFDGRVSRLYAPALNRHDAGLPMGPIVGATLRSD